MEAQWLDNFVNCASKFIDVGYVRNHITLSNWEMKGWQTDVLWYSYIFVGHASSALNSLNSFETFIQFLRNTNTGFKRTSTPYLLYLFAAQFHGKAKWITKSWIFCWVSSSHQIDQINVGGQRLLWYHFQ